MAIIYLIVNPKGKIYVGQTNNLYNRLKSHKSSAKSNKNIILYHSIRKYGWENHVVSILEEVDYEIKDEREIFWIKELNSFCGLNKMGMNMSLGGAQGNPYSWKHDKERVEKARLRMLGQNNHSYGIKQTQENKKIVGDKARKRNLERGQKVPRWGAEKSWANSSKKVVAYNLKGEFVSCYCSCSEAGRQLGIKGQEVSAVARGRQEHTNSYIFRFYEDNYPNRIDVTGIKFLKYIRPIVELNINKEVVREFKDCKEAEAQTGEPHGNISRGAREKRRLRSGYFFMYKDDYEEIMRELNQVINN